MDRLLEAFLDALQSNPLVALVLFSIMGNVFLGATVRRLFALYTTTMEKRITEAERSREAIADNTRVLERVADILKVSIK